MHGWRKMQKWSNGETLTCNKSEIERQRQWQEQFFYSWFFLNGTEGYESGANPKSLFWELELKLSVWTCLLFITHRLSGVVVVVVVVSLWSYLCCATALYDRQWCCLGLPVSICRGFASCLNPHKPQILAAPQSQQGGDLMSPTWHLRRAVFTNYT